VSDHEPWRAGNSGYNRVAAWAQGVGKTLDRFGEVKRVWDHGCTVKAGHLTKSHPWSSPSWYTGVLTGPHCCRSSGYGSSSLTLPMATAQLWELLYWNLARIEGSRVGFRGLAPSDKACVRGQGPLGA
jgi:hypothetical protein